MRHLLAFALACLTPTTFAGERTWDALKRIEQGQTITVRSVDGAVTRGRLETASDVSLTLRTKANRELILPRGSIDRVTKKSRLKGALWGGVVCFGISAPIGAWAGPYLADWGNPSGSTRFRHAMGFGAFFGGIGAGIGALTGMQSTIYEAPERAREIKSSASSRAE